MSGMLAKVLNSTVGTSSFKSLDEVLPSKIYDKFKADVGLVGSEKVLYTYGGAWTALENSDSYRRQQASTKIKFGCGGVVLFKTVQALKTSQGEIRIEIKNNAGTVLKSATYTLPASTSDLTEVELSCPFNVTAGTEYTVLLLKYGSNPTTNFHVCAEPVMFCPTVTLV